MTQIDVFLWQIFYLLSTPREPHSINDNVVLYLNSYFTSIMCLLYQCKKRKQRIKKKLLIFNNHFNPYLIPGTVPKLRNNNHELWLDFVF